MRRGAADLQKLCQYQDRRNRPVCAGGGASGTDCSSCSERRADRSGVCIRHSGNHRRRGGDECRGLWRRDEGRARLGESHRPGWLRAAVCGGGAGAGLSHQPDPERSTGGAGSEAYPAAGRSGEDPGTDGGAEGTAGCQAAPGISQRGQHL